MKTTYDKALEELQLIVAALQEDSLSIDELSVKTKRAAELIAFCRERLRQTEEGLESLFGEDS